MKKIGLVGFGWRLARVLIAMKRTGWDFEIAGFVDPSSNGQAIAAAEGIEAGEEFASIEALYAAAPLDLVMIGSPNHLHLEHLKACLARTVPVFCEKPIVRTESESIELASLLASRSDLPPLFVGLVLRSMPLVKEAIGRIHRGDLGTLVSIDATEFLVPEHGAYLARNWRRKSEWGGSFLLDKACHDFDVFGWATGSLPRRAMSMGGLGVFKSEQADLKRKYADGRTAYELAPGGWSSADDAFSSDMDVSDYQVALVEYDNDVKLTFHSNSHSAIPERRWVFMGTDGAMIVDLTRNQISFQKSLTLAEGRLGPPEPELRELGALDSESHNGADYAMARDLLASLNGAAPYPVTAWDSLEAGLAVMAVDQSLAAGQVVDCRPMWARLAQARGRAGPSASR
jgi:predicted dehydrogenase